MLIDRSRDRPIRYFEWRVRLFGVGAILALAGMYAEQGWMINLAIVILFAGMLLRFLPDRGGGGPESEADESGP